LTDPGLDVPEARCGQVVGAGGGHEEADPEVEVAPDAQATGLESAEAGAGVADHLVPGGLPGAQRGVGLGRGVSRHDPSDAAFDEGVERRPVGHLDADARAVGRSVEDIGVEARYEGLDERPGFPALSGHAAESAGRGGSYRTS